MGLVICDVTGVDLRFRYVNVWWPEDFILLGILGPGDLNYQWLRHLGQFLEMFHQNHQRLYKDHCFIDKNKVNGSGIANSTLQWLWSLILAITQDTNCWNTTEQVSYLVKISISQDSSWIFLHSSRNSQSFSTGKSIYKQFLQESCRVGGPRLPHGALTRMPSWERCKQSGLCRKSCRHSTTTHSATLWSLFWSY